jgi:hypothetical protein
MQFAVLNDRIERNIKHELPWPRFPDLSCDLKSFLNPHGLAPVQEIANVGSVHFDNKDCDLCVIVCSLVSCLSV